MIKMLNIKNFVIKTLLRDIKSEAPYYYMQADTFYPKQEKIVKDLLNDEKTTVLLTFNGETITPYSGPFELRGEKQVMGYSIINTYDNSLWALFVSMGTGDDTYIRENLFKRAMTYLDKDKKIYMPYPYKKMWVFCNRKIPGKIKIPY